MSTLYVKNFNTYFKALTLIANNSIYQYRCIAGAYINIPNSADKRNYQVCSLPPQQKIKCRIRAVNNAGTSGTAITDVITTPCGGELIFKHIMWLITAVALDCIKLS